MRIRFLSRNEHKIAEARTILSPHDVDVIPINLPINELQTIDVKMIVRDKTLRAFGQIGHRLFVEQTCLYLESLNGFPAGLTQPFWDTLKAERFAELFGQQEKRSVTAKTWIGYCDGYEIHHFQGEIKGTVAPEPRGDRSFQWDCVFIPDGHSETFAEMGKKKNEISMRRIALNRLAEHLVRTGNA